MAAMNDYTADRAEAALVKLSKSLDSPQPLHHADALNACNYIQAIALTAIAHAVEKIADNLGAMADVIESWDKEGVPSRNATKHHK